MVYLDGDNTEQHKYVDIKIRQKEVLRAWQNQPMAEARTQIE